MTSRDRAYLEHIQECIRRIEENTKGGRKAFLSSHTLQDAVLRNLQTLSEATQRVSDTLKGTHPEIEWMQIAAFRNILVHDYLGVDTEQIWQIVRRDIPKLKAAVVAMLSESD
jgi:uncharacterized protein with HEPN domain